jgi:hypothetical protein
MGIMRVRLKIRTLLIAIVAVGVAIGTLTNTVVRARRAAALHFGDSYHAEYARRCVKRIPDDFRQALLCLQWENELRPAPAGCVFNGAAMGMVNTAQHYRRTVMHPGMSYPGATPNPRFRGWTLEAIWWAREMWRDSVRATWHKSMSDAYNRAAADPAFPLPDESTEPYSDMPWLRQAVRCKR